MPARPLLHLVIPGLAWPRQALQDLCFDLPLPGLDALLSPARLMDSPQDAVLSTATDPERCSLVAPLRLLGLGGNPGEAPWICLDPVHVGLHERSIGLIAGDDLQLSADEASELAGALGKDLAELGTLHLGDATRWHLQLHAEAPLPGLPPLTALIGRSAAADSLSGDRTWRRVLNDVQMNLHAHPLNEQRTAAGKPVINSLWPWGAGSLGAAPTTNVEQIWCKDDAVLRGLAKHANIACSTLPDANSLRLTVPSLLWLDDLAGPTRAQDAQSWRGALANLDEMWFAPLAAQRHKGELGDIAVHLPPVAQGSTRHLRLPQHGFAQALSLQVRRALRRPQPSGLQQVSA
jgi:hypothetical protein